MIKKILLSILFLFIFIGFYLGFIIKEDRGCTLRGCFCEDNPHLSTIPCNTCLIYDPIFFTGIIDYTKNCRTTEFLICENGNEIEYHKSDDYLCKNKIEFLRIKDLLKAETPVFVSQQTMP